MTKTAPLKIQTPFGARTVVQRVGASGEYYRTLPTPSAPHGEWWTLNPQRGFVPVASNSRALQAALAVASVSACDVCGACPCYEHERRTITPSRAAADAVVEGLRRYWVGCVAYAARNPGTPEWIHRTAARRYRLALYVLGRTAEARAVP